MVEVDVSNVNNLCYGERATSAELVLYLRSEIWQRLVPQLALQENVIRDAVVAVGTLHRASWLTESSSPSNDDRCSLQRFALSRYSRAMLQLRSGMADQSIANPEHVILVSCLLFVCFESLQDSQSAVMMHLRNGLRIIHDVFKSELEFATTYHGAVVLRGAQKDAIDDLVSVFSQLDYDASRLGSGRRLIPLSEVPDHPTSDGALPFVFTSIAAAKWSLDSLAGDLNGLQNYLFELATEAVSLDPGAPSDLRARQAYLHALTRFVRLDESGPGFEKRRATLLQQLDQLGASMAMLMDDPTYEEAPEAISLQLHFTLVHFLAVNLRNTHEAKCDTFLPAFERVVGLAEQYPYTERMKPGHTSIYSFHLQNRMLRTIYLIAMKCREPRIRRRAISLLRTSAFQEKMWNSAAYALHAERLAALEENASESEGAKSALTAADITDDARFCDILIAGDLSNPGAARFVLAKYLHTESSVYPKILVMEEEYWNNRNGKGGRKSA